METPPVPGVRRLVHKSPLAPRGARAARREEDARAVPRVDVRSLIVELQGVGHPEHVLLYVEQPVEVPGIAAAAEGPVPAGGIVLAVHTVARGPVGMPVGAVVTAAQIPVIAPAPVDPGDALAAQTVAEHAGHGTAVSVHTVVARTVTVQA